MGRGGEAQTNTNYRPVTRRRRRGGRGGHCGHVLLASPADIKKGGSAELCPQAGVQMLPCEFLLTGLMTESLLGLIAET